MNETTTHLLNQAKHFFKHKFSIAPVLFLFFITILFFYPLFLHPNEMMFPGYDIFGIFYYEKLFFVKSIITYHQIPLWNPYVLSGSPFLANPTTAVFYPTTLLFLLFPVYRLFGFLFWFDIFLSGFFTYIYCKSIRLETFPSLLSSVSFMFSGMLITLFIPGHLVVLDTIIWFPLSLFLVNKIVERQKFTTISSLGIIIALTIFAGHTQIAFYSLAFTFFYFFFLLLNTFLSHKKNKSFVKIVSSFLISLLIGTGISSIQLIPSMEFASLSSRALGVSFEFASSFSIHPYQLLTMLLPHFFGDNLIFWGKANFPISSIYIGVISLFFVIFSFVKKDKYMLFFCILAALSFIYATGEHMFLFPMLYSLFPKLNSFRVPSRTLYFFVFSLSIMSGFGAQNFLYIILLNANLVKKITLGMITGVIFLLAIVIFIYINPISFKLYEKFILRNSFAGGMDHFYIFNLLKSDLIIVFTMITSITITLLSLIFKKISTTTFKVLIIFLVLSDLFIFGQIFIQTKSPNEIFRVNTERQKIFEDRSLYRVFNMEGTFQGLQNNLIPNITGVHSLYLKSLENFIYKIGPHFNQNYESFFLFSNIDNPEILKMFNVKYVIAHKIIDNDYLRLVSSDNVTFLYELKNTYPRVYFSDVKDKTGYFTPDQTTSLQISNYTPNKIELASDATRSGRIVLSEIGYPGWKVKVDSKETHMETVNAIFRSVEINKGKHKIEFIYDPLSFKMGGLVSGFTTMLTVLGFLIFRKRSN